MKKHRRIVLTNEQRDNLKELACSDMIPENIATKARILLMTDRSKGYRTLDSEIIANLGTSICTIIRTRKAFCEKGLDAIIHHTRRAPRKSKFHNMDLSDLVLSVLKNPPPTGCKRWTIRLLTSQISATDEVESISYSKVYQVLRKLNISLK